MKISGEKMKRKAPVLLLVSTLLFACSEGPYSGFSEIDYHLFYKLRAYDDSGKVLAEKDHVWYTMKVFAPTDSLLFNSGRIFPAGMECRAESLCHSFFSIKPTLGKWASGDSMTLIIDNYELVTHPGFLKYRSEGPLRVELKILKALSPEQFEDYVRMMQETGDIQEGLIIAEFIKKQKEGFERTGSGIYFHEISPGSGDPPSRGKNVKISYSGSFLGGEAFDVGTMEFKLGQEMQILRGLELAIYRMKPGGKAKIIIPSYLAYGERGSSTGTVPPFTPVVYQVHLIEIIE
jgi:hypothetical protein